MKPGFYLTYALRSLHREGQRSLLAVTCIAFGVLALVSMQLLAAMIDDVFLVDPVLSNGGHVTLQPTTATTPEAFATSLAPLLTDGTLDATTVRAAIDAILISVPSSGHVRMLTGAQAVDPATFPIVGSFVLSDGKDLAEALAPLGSAVITKDIAEDLALAEGDLFRLSNGEGAAPIQLTVGGIAEQSPSKIGNIVFMSLTTLAQFTSPTMQRVSASATWTHRDAPDAHVAKLEDAGFRVRLTPDEPNSEAAHLFSFMLAAAGILGLFIGGIGVANTMQVMLARRTKEIATLKTVGYQQKDLMVLFGLEAIFLGLVGGLVGVLLALLVSGQLVNLLDATTPFLFTYRADLGILAGGLLTGMLTALIFGLVAIVKASAQRPGVLLRGDVVAPSRQQRIQSASLYGVLLLLFGVLSAALLGSWLQGAGVVAFGILSLGLLAVVLGGLLWLLVRIPIRGLPLLSMARRNLQHEPRRAISALIALFIGVFSIGFASAALLNASARSAARTLSQEGYNMLAFTNTHEEANLRATLESAGANSVRVDRPLIVDVFALDGTLIRANHGLKSRAADDLFWDVTSDQRPTTSDEIWIGFQLRQAGVESGDSLLLRRDTSAVMVRVAGAYEPRREVNPIQRTFSKSIGLTSTLAPLFAEDGAIILNAALPTERLVSSTQSLGTAFPNAVLLNKSDLDEFVNRQFRGLFYFVIAVAGLSFVAGAVLIANAVGIEMVERRREMGILKAVGYTSRDVLRTVLLENALLGLIAGVLGWIGVLLVMEVVNVRFPTAHLSLTLWQGLVLTAFSVVLATVSAMLVAWHPTHIRPLQVLRQSD